MKYTIALSALAAITLVSAQDECSQDYDGYFEYNPVPIDQALTDYGVSKTSFPSFFSHEKILTTISASDLQRRALQFPKRRCPDGSMQEDG